MTSPSRIPSSTMDWPCTTKAYDFDGLRTKDDGTSMCSSVKNDSIGEPAATRPNKGKERDSTTGGVPRGVSFFGWVGDGFWVVNTGASTIRSAREFKSE